MTYSKAADISGRAWVFGDNVDTDVLAPGIYMKAGIDTLARHCLEAVRADFAAEVSAGDFLVAGRNFGMGSSREQAAQVLKHLGVGAVIAESFGGIFYRNALNLGLLALTCHEAAKIQDGDEVSLNPATGALRISSQETHLQCDPIPPHLLAMIGDGGLVPHLSARLRAGAVPSARYRQPSPDGSTGELT